jgi:polar amino acid transport system permease protein
MSSSTQPDQHRHALYRLLDRLPYWLLFACLLGIMVVWKIATDADYWVIFAAVAQGIWTTIYVTLISYSGALVVGLLVGLMRVSKNRVIYEVGTFYVEIVRGVPILVLLFYIAFVGAPQLVAAINWIGVELESIGMQRASDLLSNLQVRDLNFTARAILALIIAYSAFLAEVFRAGIESIEKGQVEAALSLGMTRWQAMRFVVLPQAVRRVLPPLGNDFIAMLKDSSLVSVLGVADITQMGRLYANSTFMFFETYNVVAFIYLTMTIALTLLLRTVERRMPQSIHE